MGPESESTILHVEIHQRAESSIKAKEIEKSVVSFLKSEKELLSGVVYTGRVLPDHVDYIRVYTDSDEKHSINLSRDHIVMRFYTYQTFSSAPQYDTLDDGDENSPPACLNWSLPSLEFEGLWESLVLDSDIKIQLLNYIQTALLYSQNQVSSQVVRWNGVVLLHGPPGTGKTSLCKALAQKLSIRLNNRYRSGQLIEINTHSLFSKWYSESPKLVFSMFKSIKKWLECEDNFVCILIDEVESLTYSRSTTSEPADSIRVVNTVLTQLDQLQRYKNYVILATSNVTDSIDIAFADRADLKLFLGYPDRWGAYEILRSCMEELIRCKLIMGSSNEIFEAYILRKMNKPLNGGDLMTEVTDNSRQLLELSTLCEGLSGRSLRKVPFLTSSKFIEKGVPTIRQFLCVMKDVVVKHKSENRKYAKENSYYLNNGI